MIPLTDMVDDVPKIYGEIAPGPAGLVSLSVGDGTQLVVDPLDVSRVSLVVEDPAQLERELLAQLRQLIADGSEQLEPVGRLVVASACYGLQTPGVPSWFGPLRWAVALSELPETLRDWLGVDPSPEVVLAALRSDPTGEPLSTAVRAAALAQVDRLTDLMSDEATCWLRAWVTSAAPADPPPLELEQFREGAAARDRALELALCALVWEAAHLRGHARAAWEEVAERWRVAQRPQLSERSRFRAVAVAPLRSVSEPDSRAATHELPLRMRSPERLVAAGPALSRRPIVVEVLADDDVEAAELLVSWIHDEILVEHRRGRPRVVRASGEPLSELTIPVTSVVQGGELSLQLLARLFRF